MRITAVRTHVLADPDLVENATSSAQDDFVVEVEAEDGTVGIGESDVNPWIARACVEAPGSHTMGLGLRDMLMGQDPMHVEGLWDRLYAGSAMNGRRGALIHALGALDLALHDLRGKLVGAPCWALLGPPARQRIMPYASLQPEGVADVDAYEREVVNWAVRAKDIGFRAAKVECTFTGPYAHLGIQASWDRVTEILSHVRAAVGSGFRLMVDVQYAFRGADEALRVLKSWEPLDLYFVETPLPSDDLEGYATLATRQPIPIAAGEWLATHHEFRELIEQGKVQVVQPDVGRVGGLTEAMRVARLAQREERTVVPHAWKTGISIAGAVHFAMAAPTCAMIEFLPKELSASALRQNLVKDPFRMDDGHLNAPEEPGLGVHLDPAAMGRFEEAARELELSHRFRSA